MPEHGLLQGKTKEKFKHRIMLRGKQQGIESEINHEELKMC